MPGFLSFGREGLPMPQMKKISKSNTTIERHDDGSVKRAVLHNTVIYESSPIREDGSRVIAICNGGYNTVTTQTRLNQIFNEEGLPLYYSRVGGGVTSNGPNEFPVPPYGRTLLLILHADGTVGECQDAFVVIN
jgi:hypothetical protein